MNDTYKIRAGSQENIIFKLLDENGNAINFNDVDYVTLHIRNVVRYDNNSVVRSFSTADSNAILSFYGNFANGEVLLFPTPTTFATSAIYEGYFEIKYESGKIIYYREDREIYIVVRDNFAD